MEAVTIEETTHDNPKIIQMKIDLEISMEKEELKKFKGLRIRERMLKEYDDGAMWHKVFFIMYKGKSVGFLSLSESAFYENLVWLSDLYIETDFRSKKIGSNALSIAKRVVCERGVDYFGVRFMGEKRKKFYHKNGFNSEMSCVNVMEI